MEKSIKIDELFYGWIAGTNDIDERGNTDITVNCYSIESLIDEMELLLDTEKNKKRGFLKTLHFIVDDIEFLVRGNENKEYTLLVLYTDKLFLSTVTKEKQDIEQTINHIKNVLKIILKNS